MSTAMKERMQDYSSLLDEYEIPYRITGSYYQTGSPSQPQGWILHISVVVSQAPALFKTILPLLYFCKCAFKIIRDRPTLMALNAGEEGFNRIGKVVCIYPDNDETALLLRIKLLSILKGLKGPAILTDYHLGGVLYTRYGSFRAGNLNVEYGQPNTVVKDGHGNAYYDQYTAPFTPNGIANPFEAFLKPSKYQNGSTLLNDKYVVKKALSMTVKGNTLLARMKNGFFRRDCILKQGRENMVADDAGRDIKDRLKWQLEVHRHLEQELPIPKAYEYFEVEGDGYLSMEYIPGLNLNYFILQTYQHSLWPYLPVSARKDLIMVMKQIVSAVKKMHSKGYVHRDINSNNFIVRKNKTIRMIDLELAYSSLTHHPEPPFESITIGYGSAQQMALMTPTLEDDIYSIGALLILFFTGLEPMLVIEHDAEHLEEKLHFLSGSSEITELIMHCIQPVPARRPSMYHVLSRIKKIEEDTRFTRERDAKQIQRPGSREAGQTIWEGLNAFMSGYLLSDQELWVSGSTGTGHLQVLPGLGRGIAGIVYLMSRAKTCGYDTYPLDTAIQNGLSYCMDLALPQLLEMPGGLYAGKEGVALMMAAAEEAGLVILNDEQRMNLSAAFTEDGEELNIIHGIAGKGLALIRCKAFMAYAAYISLLDHYAFEIIQCQEEDGSWCAKNEEKLTGFNEGIAGIIYFLLEYCMESGNEATWLAISNGLAYLDKTAVKGIHQYSWHSSDLNKTVGEYWSNGVPGIALCFLKAFKVTGVSRYKTIAEKALNFHPPVFLHYNLSLSNGLAGLGEIYLEAYEILQSDIYLQRANWIADLLIHLKVKISGNSCIWYAENNYCPAPDLMTGCSGIIHFLLRHRYRGKLSLPFVS